MQVGLEHKHTSLFNLSADLGIHPGFDLGFHFGSNLGLNFGLKR